MLIVGAGLSGLIAANLMPDATIIEAGPERDVSQHRALLRFRGPEVGNAIGIEFKPVTVNKGIFFSGEFRAPNIRMANLYSQKVVGTLGDRSIWKVEPVTRYIAPENLYERLIARCKSRISWGKTVDLLNPQWKLGTPVISTAPLGETAKNMMWTKLPEFTSAAIKVRRWRLMEGSNVYQTVYFPEPSINLYRASITGNLLIAEYADRNGYVSGDDQMFHAFAIRGAQQELDETKQRYGKIAPVDEAWRREAIYQLTRQHNIYSLGRFATWRNILLDDVLKDVYVIKRLMESDSYTRAKMGA